MTVTMNNILPSRPRRNLNDTIGHLDKMIDGLSEAIPGTIRDTLQETVGAAIGEGVRAALLEIVSNPDVLALLRGALPAPMAVPITPDAPRESLVGTLLRKVCSAVITVARWFKSGVVTVAGAVAECTCTTLNKLAELGQRLRSLRKARRPLLLALVVGSLVAFVALVAPNWVGATLSGLGGAGITLAVQAGLWLRQHLGTLLVVSD
jgi:hypothetical protein